MISKKIKTCLLSLLFWFAAVGLAAPLIDADIEESNVCIQHDGFEYVKWYLASGGGQSYKFDVATNRRVEIEGADFEGEILRVLPFGQSDIAVFTPNGIYCYHTITDTSRLLKTAADASEIYLLLDKGSDAEISTMLIDKMKSMRKGFGVINYSVLAAYLLVLVVMGFYFSKKEKSTNDFFLAGQRIPWWAAGLSIFGTQLSAITFMAMPAKAYSADWHYFILNMSIWLIATPLAVFVFVPFFRRLNVNTAYEYLERRFDVKVRFLASFIYVLSQLLKMGIVIFLPAIALSTVTGMNIRLCIVLIGLLCTLYTVMGGIEAVIWTDVIQVVVLLGGAIVCGVIILFDLGADIPEMFASAYSEAKFSLGSRNIDFTRPTLIVILISMLASPVPYISDQTVIQRYLTTKDEKATRKALWTNAAMTIPATLIFFGLGTLFYMFYKSRPSLLSAGMQNDSVFPWFVLNQLPVGVSGLLVAGVFAAAMSSLDSSMNSSASAIINDFIARINSKMTDIRRLYYARLLTVLFGVFATAGALVMSFYDIKSLWDIAGRLAGLVTGGLCAFFILAAFTKRTNGTGAIVGAVVSSISIFMIQEHTNLHFFLYGTISIAIACATGYIVSLFIGSSKEINGMTIYTIEKEQETK